MSTSTTARINNTALQRGGRDRYPVRPHRRAARARPPAECNLIFVADSNKWWESREQTFVDEITIDYAQLFAWMAPSTSNQSSIMYITVRNIPTR